mmetsp:Transcript_13912/g.34362  ORF Transcript_13912/g.34362 Transcript_13912/m.34362 type:complete len:383 (-) Transcript_13912:145-1293(-)|eukprot:g12617.t1
MDELQKVEEDLFGEGIAGADDDLFPDGDAFRVPEQPAGASQNDPNDPDYVGEDEEGGELAIGGVNGAVNDFADAVARLTASRRKARTGHKLKEKDCKQQAATLIQYMEDYHKQDLEEVQADRPALMKAANMDNVKKLVARQGFKQFFVYGGGVDVLTRWITPVEGVEKDRAEPPISVIYGVLDCLQVLGSRVEKDDIKNSGVGAQMRRIMRDKKYPVHVRQQAQQLVTQWVTYVTAPGKRPREDDDEGANAGPAGVEEAEEVDERGRKVRGDQLAVLGDGGPRRKTERELNAIWAPTAEDEKLFEDRRKMRHAMLPMEKPVFDLSVLPPSHAPARKKAKEDPTSTVGKLGAQLQKISNPNKKAWKSAVGQVSISGRDIVYKW